MGSVFWHLANRTAETQFIFNLFHLLLAGLTLLVLLHQRRTNRDATTRDPNRLLAAGFLRNFARSLIANNRMRPGSETARAFSAFSPANSRGPTIG